MKGKFKFSSGKDDKQKENKNTINNQNESETFNINELQKYYTQFS